MPAPRLIAALFLVFGCQPSWASSTPLAPISVETLAEARTLVSRMRLSPKGPYSRINWFCNDGSIHPPQAYVCRERGGGRQHAAYSDERARLAALGWHVGTVIAAMDYQEFIQNPPRYARLQELALEKYLVDVDNGWVLEQAANYRGRVQIEDEERSGRDLLLRLFAEPDWLVRHYFLAMQLVVSVPNGNADLLSYQIRKSAQRIAEQNNAFQRLRIEIHSSPSPLSAARVRYWVSQQADINEDLKTQTQQLATDLDSLYGEGARRERMLKAEQSLAKTIPQISELLSQARQNKGLERISRLSTSMEILRQHIPAQDPKVSLYRLHLMHALATEVRAEASDLMLFPSLNRRALIQLTDQLLTAAWASGLLSEDERAALQQPLQHLLQQESISGKEYAQATRRLSLAAAWAAMTVRYQFADALHRYIALEPKAERFIDEVLRGSVLLPLSDTAHLLALDGANAAGLSHHFFGQRTARLLGINPGVARAKLRVMTSEELAQGIQAQADEIVFLPETVAELTPVAGILTMGEGNPLSHIQMLARNLGIPNLVINPELVPQILERAGQPILLAVAADGRAYLETEAQLPSALNEAKEVNASTTSQTELITTAPPELTQKALLPLAMLHSGLSGHIVGPKAANVGELARRFPGRIAPALALPFGLFADYTVAQRERVATAYQQFRQGEIDQTKLDAELDWARHQVQALELSEAHRSELQQMMQQEFGEGNYGVFVRSDTNVEDLPEFTGAGLNETLPNVVGLERQLSGISRVWSSIYSRRAMAWRSRILAHPDQVYSSILLMKSIPAEKSGVLVTRNLVGDAPGLTVSVAWGVGGAVDNESAASYVLSAQQPALLLSEAKAAYQRVISSEGGIAWVPAPSGTLLSEAEQQALLQLAEEVTAQYPASLDKQGQALPWDIEFAFAEGKLWLLQIRPLVQRGHLEAANIINQVLPTPTAADFISLDEKPISATGKHR